jgi:hypothetical protein
VERARDGHHGGRPQSTHVLTGGEL